MLGLALLLAALVVPMRRVELPWFAPTAALIMGTTHAVVAALALLDARCRLHARSLGTAAAVALATLSIPRALTFPGVVPGGVPGVGAQTGSLVVHLILIATPAFLTAALVYRGGPLQRPGRAPAVAVGLGLAAAVVVTALAVALAPVLPPTLDQGGFTGFSHVLSSLAAAVAERMRTAMHSVTVLQGRARISVGWAAAPAGADPTATWRAADEVPENACHKMLTVVGWDITVDYSPPGIFVIRGGAMARILVAEADPQARHYLNSVLEHAGHEVVEVASGDGALRALVSERIDVAVTELRLPGLTGAGLVRAAARVDEHIGCLVLGGFRDLGAIDDALEAGAVGIIPKPATACQVVCCVARAYERRLLAGEAVRGRLLNGLVEAWIVSGCTGGAAAVQRSLPGIAVLRRPDRRPV